MSSASRLMAWREGGTLWLFANARYRPSGWLRRVQEPTASSYADMLCRRLSGNIRRELLSRFASLYGAPIDLRVEDDSEQLASLFWRGRIQVFRLPASDHLMRLFDPSYHLFCSPPEFFSPLLDAAPSQALAARRNALAWELGEIVAAREDWRRPHLPPIATPVLAQLGVLEVSDADGSLIFSLALAARPHASRYAEAQRELEQLGLRSPDSPEALEHAAQQGLAQLRMLASEPASHCLLRDFFFPQRGWMPRDTTPLTLGLDAPITLALLSSGNNHLLGEQDLIGPFSGKALMQLAATAHAIQYRNQRRHTAAVASAQAPSQSSAPLPVASPLPAPADHPPADTEHDPKQQAAARWQCRQRQIAAAKQRRAATPPGPERDRLIAATERFERNNLAEQKALLSEHVYEDDEPPPGWVDISKNSELLAKYGLEADLLESSGSNFRARLYLPDPAVFGDDVKPTLVFRGTETLGDWKNNIQQAFGLESEYYQRAVRIGQRLKRAAVDIELAGHSLGGGMASAAARASGLPAMTYNAAGLRRKTLKRNNVSPVIPDPYNLLAYRVRNELLTGAHEPGWKTGAAFAGAGLSIGSSLAVGGPVGALGGVGASLLLGKLMPEVAGTPYELPGKGNPYSRHRMKQVLWGLEQQIEADQAVLSAATGVCCT